MIPKFVIKITIQSQNLAFATKVFKKLGHTFMKQYFFPTLEIDRPKQFEHLMYNSAASYQANVKHQGIQYSVQCH